MKYYFSIQQKRLGRLLKSSGIHPVGAIILTLIGFSTITYVLFENTIYAKYIYPLIGLSLMLSLVKSEKINFLKLCFSEKDYLKIRLFENLFIIIPFLVGLIAFNELLIGGIYIIVGITMSFVKLNSKINLVLPTPFYKNPFEFIIGFRKIFLVFLGF